MADHEATGGLADVDAVVAVSGMAHDPFVLFVKSVHRRPGECDPCLQLARVGGQVDVPPRPSRRALLARPDGVPGRETEVVVLSRDTWPKIDDLFATAGVVACSGLLLLLSCALAAVKRKAAISENEVRVIRCFLLMEFTALNLQAQNSKLRFPDSCFCIISPASILV